MRLSRLYLSKKRPGSKILYPSKSLLGFGYGIFLVFAAIGNLFADDPVTPTTAADAGAQSPGSSTSNTSQTPGNSQTPDNNQTPDSSQLPDSSQTPSSSQSLNTPLLPQLPSNPVLQGSSSGVSNQSTQLTTPGLYATGAYDLSQIANNAGLAQAFGTAEGSSESSPTSGPLGRIRLGPFDLKCSMTTSVVSDDNIFAGEQGMARTSDTNLVLSPAVLLQYGNFEGQKGYASFVYAPTLIRFFQNSAENSDNQNFAFSASYPLQRLSLNVIDTYTQVTGINQDLNSRTTQTTNLAVLGASYEIGEKLTATSKLQELNTTFTNGAGQGDTVTSLNNSLSYSLTEKLALGPSVNLGYEEPKGSTKQTFEQALLGVNYQLSEKISLVGQGGLEFRQYDQGGDNSNPVFSAGISYTPLESTSLTVNGFQNVEPSTANSQQTSVNSGVGFNATQRLMQKFFLAFSFNFSHTEYQDQNGNSVQNSALTGTNTTTTTTGNSTGSTQENLVYRPSLTYVPSEWVSFALYYQYRDNIVDAPTGGYHDNQVGVSISAQF